MPRAKMHKYMDYTEVTKLPDSDKVLLMKNLLKLLDEDRISFSRKHMGLVEAVRKVRYISKERKEVDLKTVAPIVLILANTARLVLQKGCKMFYVTDVTANEVYGYGERG